MYPIPPIAEPTFADVPSEVSIAPASANPMVASLKKFSHLHWYPPSPPKLVMVPEPVCPKPDQE